VVGDPDQSIYSWRGANVYNILHFERDYPEAVVVKLEQNYRSTSTILEAANALIRTNQDRLDKRLFSDLGVGEKIGLYAAQDEKDEADFISRLVMRHIRAGRSYEDIVIFFRTNAQSRALEDLFLMHRLPYRIIGGLSFYQRKEIKDILAFLRMVVSDSDFISFIRTINLPKRGLGPSAIDKLRLESNRQLTPIFETIQSPDLELTPKQKKSVQEYVDLIKKLREKRKSFRLSELVIAVVQDTGYLGVLHEDPETFSDKKENIDELISKSFEWEAEREDPTLERFLEELSLKSNLDESDPTGEKISLMTIHNGKGLEFPIVFLVGMEETLFPHINSMGKKEAIEEERRLCYVGITRAREKLYLSYARSRNLWGSWRPMQPSRFLREIPKEYLEKMSRF
jgi:DNA helicase-2/ATP-dependent DNA helicase PcrA